MLFMVIENFKNRNLIRERFERDGRLLPEGVTYRASWVDTAGRRCFQLMEATDKESLAAWVDKWKDLVDFEVVAVLTSNEFWSRDRAG
jgi:Domain of unknown function (DUF3303)